MNKWMTEWRKHVNVIIDACRSLIYCEWKCIEPCDAQPARSCITPMLDRRGLHVDADDKQNSFAEKHRSCNVFPDFPSSISWCVLPRRSTAFKCHCKERRKYSFIIPMLVTELMPTFEKLMITMFRTSDFQVGRSCNKAKKHTIGKHYPLERPLLGLLGAFCFFPKKGPLLSQKNTFFAILTQRRAWLANSF